MGAETFTPRRNDETNEQFNVWNRALNGEEKNKKEELRNRAEKAINYSNPAEEEFFDIEYDDKEEYEDNVEKEKSIEERQVEDLEVLFSFCGQKDILKILKSDEYGKLLENHISLLDLFNANALFDERYYEDQFPSDDFMRFSYGNKLEEKQIERNWNSRHRIELLQKRMDEYYDKRKTTDADDEQYMRDNLEYYDNENPFSNPEDVERAKEARKTISEIANTYCGEDKAKLSTLKDVIRSRASGEELSEEQKGFLRGENTTTTDRLLYDGHVINRERANKILDNLESLEGKDSIKRLRTMVYSKYAIDDFIKFGRGDLVYDACKKLAEVVDDKDNFDALVTQSLRLDDDVNPKEVVDELIFDYSDPYKLVSRAKDYNLCDSGRNDDEFEYYYYIDNPDRIVDNLTKREWQPGFFVDRFISSCAQTLKDLGVSDEAIVRNCDYLQPLDFTGYYGEAIGTRLIEVGIDKKEIVKKVFSSTSHQKASPFEKNGYKFEGKSYVETLEENGFDITDIAKTFSPDAIGKNLEEFIDRGADAKELIKYMASYREQEVSKNPHKRMIIRSENRPEGITVFKEGMRGKGIDYVALNLDTFARNGVTEEDIMEAIDESTVNPYGYFIPKMLECGEFNTQKILELGREKYIKSIEKDIEQGHRFPEMIKEPSYYYSSIISQMSGVGKKERDEYYANLVAE